MIWILILRVQGTLMSFKSSFGTLEDAGECWLGFGILIMILIWSVVFNTPMICILAFYIEFWRCKVHPCHLSPEFWLWRMLEVPDWGLTSWSLFGYGHWSLIPPYLIFLFYILTLKVQGPSMSFKSWFGALEDTEGSWLGFGILILIRIWSLVFDTHMFWISALFLDF